MADFRGFFFLNRYFSKRKIWFYFIFKKGLKIGRDKKTSFEKNPKVGHVNRVILRRNKPV